MPRSNRKLSFLPLLFALASPATLADTVSMGVGIMNGISVEYTKPFSEKLNLRLALTSLPLEADFDEDGIEYEGEWTKNNAGVLLDWRPFSGSFHITAGLYAGGNELKLKASSKDEDLEIGDETYTASDLTLKSEVTYADTAPYLGIGWGNAAQGGAITMNFDLGILAAGSPSLSYDASGTIEDPNNPGLIIDVSSSPELQEDLEKERIALEEDFEDFEFLPVIHFSIGYRF